MAGGVRVGIAFNQASLAASPTWTYLTDTNDLVAGYTIDRGRQFETDKTEGGTATVTINDVHGVLDPTNSSGPYYGWIEPLLQIKIDLWNPVSSAYFTRFRGFIEDYNYRVDPSQKLGWLEIDCVDIFAILTAIEMQPGQFGDVPPAASANNVFFDNATAHDRIVQVLGNAGIPVGFYVVFTLNVNMLESTYSPSENVLQVVQDAADAEFPTVSNVYTDRLGRLAVHGRLAKFDPAGTAASAGTAAWDFHTWKAGDSAAIAGSTAADTAQIRTLAFIRGMSKVINSALCTPNGATAIASQYYASTASIAVYGYQSWSAENLFVKSGILTGNTGPAECLAYATYMVLNYQNPRDRITDISFRSLRPDDSRASPLWDLLTRIDISDVVDITESSPGGGGFSLEPFFVEGIHEEARPLNGSYADVTMTLDLSPQAYFSDTSTRVGLGG